MKRHMRNGKKEGKNTHKTSQQCINSCCVVVVVTVYVVLSGITKARQMKILKNKNVWQKEA